MKTYLKLFVLIFLFSAVMGKNGLAQEQPSKGGFFDGIKAQMMSAVKENQELATENKTLKAQLVGLQLEVEQYEGEIEELAPGYADAVESVPAQHARSPSWNDYGDDALIQEAQEIYLSGRLLDLDEQQRLQELKLYDLQYQKQEVQLDLQSQEALYQEVDEERQQELDVLQGDIQGNRVKEKDLSLKAAELEKAALAYPQEIDLLKMENKALKQKIHDLKRMLSR